MPRSVRTHLEIWRVAGVRPRSVVQSMLLAKGIVVGTRGRKRSRKISFTTSDSVEVNSMYARSEMSRADIDMNDSVVTLPQLRGSCARTAGIGE